MSKPKLKLWVFQPNDKDRSLEWKYPKNYIRAGVGELRAKLLSDTPMDDTSIYEPGWKRMDDEFSPEIS